MITQFPLGPLRPVDTVSLVRVQKLRILNILDNHIEFEPVRSSGSKALLNR